MARTRVHARPSLVASSGRKTSSPIKLRDRTRRDSLSPAATPVTVRTHRRRRAGADPWLPKRKKPTQPRAPPATHLTCRICVEEKPLDMFIKWVGSIKRHSPEIGIPYLCVPHLCRNPRRKNDPVCKECIGDFLSARLDAVGARQVGAGCLEPGCETPWTFDSIMRHFPKGPQLEKYNLDMLSVWMEDLNPQLLSCVREDCSAVGMLDPLASGYPQVACHVCSTRMCAVCKIVWHKDITCAEHAAKKVDEKMSDNEKDTLQLMQTKDGKRCPNCHMVIEKDGGCDSMHCMGCQKYFNWQTAASAVPGTKKAMQTLPGQPYWHYHQNRKALCETDAFNKAERAKKRAEKMAEKKRKREEMPLRRSVRRATLDASSASSTSSRKGAGH